MSSPIYLDGVNNSISHENLFFKGGGFDLGFYWCLMTDNLASGLPGARIGWALALKALVWFW